MFSPTQLMTMLRLQASMNDKANPTWVTDATPFLRAVIVEGGEAMEHHGWKWWKKQTMDKAQFQMELVDIWHFMLSDSLQHLQGDINATASKIGNVLRSEYALEGIMFDGRYYTFAHMNLMSKVELLIGLSCGRRVSFPLFQSLMLEAGMSHDELFRQYVGKNVLNIFRQNNGYKQGTYVKTWAGREDNEHLVELMDKLDTSSGDFPAKLAGRLSDLYVQVLALKS